MATPAQLMEAMSEATGVPLATVVDMDRRLVKAGLRTKGGRGFNVAQVTPLDAARLLTAILASSQANLAADAVERYAQTRIDKVRSSEGRFATTELDDLASLPTRHGFVTALAALIASASTGSLAKLIAGSANHAMPRIEVFAFTRGTRGRIRISGLPNGMAASVEYVPVEASKAPHNEERGDLEQSRRVTEQTIVPIARLLAEESPDD
jgi:hypothetical protein